MKFWVYAIDWRSLVVELLYICKTEQAANRFKSGYIGNLPVAERDDFVACKSLGITPVTPDIEKAVDEFEKLNGKVGFGKWPEDVRR